MPQATQTQLVQRLKPVQTVKIRGIPKSLYDAVKDDPDRFAKDLKGNRKIVDFGSFVLEANKIFSHGKQSNAKNYFFDDIEKELYRIMFNSRTIKDTVVKNIGLVEANKIYAKPQVVPTQTTIPQPPPQTMFTKTSQVKGYQNKRGIATRSYVKNNPSRFQPVQKTFLGVRRQKKEGIKNVLSDYRRIFPNDKRSNSSIKTRYYRA